jgi:hypothetical protein
MICPGFGRRFSQPQPHRWNIDAVRRQAIRGVNPAKQAAAERVAWLTRSGRHDAPRTHLTLE